MSNAEPLKPFLKSDRKKFRKNRTVSRFSKVTEKNSEKTVLKESKKQKKMKKIHYHKNFTKKPS